MDLGDGLFPCPWHFICRLCSVLSGCWGRATCLGHTEPASLREEEGRHSLLGETQAQPCWRRLSPPLSCQHREA